jgi:hypothetical protein
MTPAVRRTVLIGAPLALAVLLLFHPQGGERVYEGIRQDATTWLVVHIGLAIGAGMLAVATYTLLDGLSGRAATIGRVALLAFVVFFIAWEATLGLGTAVLVEYANGLPAGERAPVADAIQDFFNNPVTGSLSVFGSIGNLAWVVAVTAAAMAFHRAGAGRAVPLLLGCSSVFVLHDAGPAGAAGLVCFAAAAALVERARTARAPLSSAVPTLADAAPHPT